jgi:hypothetical protein
MLADYSFGNPVPQCGAPSDAPPVLAVPPVPPVPDVPDDFTMSMQDAVAGMWVFDGVTLGSPDKELQPTGGSFEIVLGPGPAPAFTWLTLGSMVQWTIGPYRVVSGAGEPLAVAIDGTVVDEASAKHSYTLTITVLAAGGKTLVCTTQAADPCALTQCGGADSGTWTAHDM